MITLLWALGDMLYDSSNKHLFILYGPGGVGKSTVANISGAVIGGTVPTISSQNIALSDWIPDVFTGGQVLFTGEKVCRNVAIVDFTSMYPSIIQGGGISPEYIDFIDHNVSHIPRFSYIHNMCAYSYDSCRHMVYVGCVALGITKGWDTDADGVVLVGECATAICHLVVCIMALMSVAALLLSTLLPIVWEAALLSASSSIICVVVRRWCPGIVVRRWRCGIIVCIVVSHLHCGGIVCGCVVVVVCITAALSEFLYASLSAALSFASLLSAPLSSALLG
jgi:hypothetical protein